MPGGRVLLATNNEPLAIVGIGCLFPAGGTTPVLAFRANLYSGVDVLSASAVIFYLGFSLLEIGKCP